MGSTTGFVGVTTLGRIVKQGGGVFGVGVSGVRGGGRVGCVRLCTTGGGHGGQVDIKGGAGTVRKGIRPKQSLGQNFLRDRNIARRIVESFREAHGEKNPSSQVVEVGPGLGALTGLLVAEFPNMVAIEIDQRAVRHLQSEYAGLNVRHGDVLDTDWGSLCEQVGDGKPMSVIGNMPYNIVSQILMSILDAPSESIGMVFMMMQKEVAERLIAPTRCKSYGILSVVTQLYGRAEILFTVGGKAFYPEPDVTSCMVRLNMQAQAGFDVKNRTLVRGLKQVVKAAFGQRRKVLRNCLRTICEMQRIEIPERWSSKRAEELTPMEFVELTRMLFARELQADATADMDGDAGRRDSGVLERNERGGVWRSNVRRERQNEKL